MLKSGFFIEEGGTLAFLNLRKDVIFETLAESVNQSSFKFEREGKMTISFDVLDMGDMMSLLGYLWLVLTFSTNGIF